MNRRSLLLGGAAAIAAGPTRAAPAPVRIGVLSDLTGPLSGVSGEGALYSAEMAVKDFGGQVLGQPIEVLSGDIGRRVDVGAGVAREWYDAGVGMICDIPNSGVALAVQALATEKNRIVLPSATGSTELTGRQCSNRGVQWTFDSYTVVKSLVGGALARGYETWFLVVTDYAYGLSLESTARAAIAAKGGKIVGSVRYPSDATDFSSFILQAQGSGAKAIGLATNSSGSANFLKQAHEFGLAQSGQHVLPMTLFLTDVHGLGLDVAQDALVVAPYYWDLDDQTRAFATRYKDKIGAMPNDTQAAAYSATNHYLKSVAAAGTVDAAAVMDKMRSIPVNDFMTHDAHIREDGRLVRDTYLFQIKTPAVSSGPWDYYKMLQRIPSPETVIPLAESRCPLVAKKG